MTDRLTVELTAEQRKLLLRGLQHMRSPVLLEMRMPSAEVTADREEQLEHIQSLVSRLEDSRPASAAAHA